LLLYSIPHGAGVLELGAQWVHGRGECPLWKFVTDNQIAVATDQGGDGDGTFYLPGGTTLPRNLLKKTLKFAENCHKYLDKFAREGLEEPPPQSVGHYLDQQFEKFLAKETNKEKLKIKKALLYWFKKWEEVDTGVDDLNNQSVLSWGEYLDYELDGYDSEPVLDGGYQALVHFLVKSLEEKAVFHTNNKVAKIEWCKDEQVSISTEKGDIFSADLVIVAVSLGVLKENHSTMFVPKLPPKKVEIIDMLGFGVMDKIFLGFTEIFWDQTKPGVQFVMTDREDRSLADTWQDHIAGFDGVCGQPNVLCGWICGDPARFMETLSEEKIIETCWSLLRRFVGDSVPCPAFCQVTRWGQHQLFKGSYSYRPPSCDELSIGPWTLATPVQDKIGRARILFAGEATDTEHYGTVTGAMLAGNREGSRVVEIIRGDT